jgi:hypothetical protein
MEKRRGISKRVLSEITLFSGLAKKRKVAVYSIPRKHKSDIHKDSLLTTGDAMLGRGG